MPIRGTSDSSSGGWNLGVAGLVLTGLAEIFFLVVLYHAYTDVRGNGRDWFVHHSGVTAFFGSGRTPGEELRQLVRGGNG